MRVPSNIQATSLIISKEKKLNENPIYKIQSIIKGEKTGRSEQKLGQKQGR